MLTYLRLKIYPGELFSARIGNLAARCESGVAWLTVSSTGTDYVLNDADQVELPKGDLLVEGDCTLSLWSVAKPSRFPGRSISNLGSAHGASFHQGASGDQREQQPAA
ncbi:DUF2917 domain-containing protein [Andreprevotia chitinilytica]|uniref:DUF2917 domain-containing protein n=1 Tax=Andreprevotia chitinilytica TaxID=396808 RepID=UPI0005599CF8|nr:DUF2917 domain-containing protein [Andreprevotia chitinilytica]